VELREYELGGLTFQLDEETAARMGAVPVDRGAVAKESPAPVNKARKPRNKLASGAVA
jgi:hypothetical protein